MLLSISVFYFLVLFSTCIDLFTTSLFNKLLTYLLNVVFGSVQKIKLTYERTSKEHLVSCRMVN